MGKFEHGIRHERGDELINFAVVNDLNVINSQFQREKTTLINNRRREVAITKLTTK